jgi:hypothetical protein
LQTLDAEKLRKHLRGDDFSTSFQEDSRGLQFERIPKDTIATRNSFQGTLTHGYVSPPCDRHTDISSSLADRIQSARWRLGRHSVFQPIWKNFGFGLAIFSISARVRFIDVYF